MDTPGEDNYDIYRTIKSVCVTRRDPPGGFTMMMMMLLMMRPVSMMVVMFLMIMMRMIKILMLQISSADRLDIEEKTCLVEEVRRTLAASPLMSSSTR